MGKSLVTGVDIGHHSIKAVVLKPKGESYSLVGYQEIVVSEDIFADNHTLNYQKIVKKLKELKKGLPLFSRKVALAVPDNAVISKVLQIDSELDASEQEFAVYQAFSHQSPLPIEELSLDFVATGEKTLGRSSSLTYQVYGTRREVIDNRLSAMSKAGFEPLLFDMQIHGLLNIWQWVSRAQQRTDWMLVDVGFSQTSLCIDFADKTPFYKDIPLGTRQLVAATSGGNADLTSPQAHFIQELVERLARQNQLFLSLQGHQPLAGIWLSGGGAATEGLAQAISERLALPCELFNPLAEFTCRASLRRQPQVDLQRFSTAAGLALRGLNWLENGHAA
ncbi:type IV pilus assembly protein PilM [Vibrio fluvialis]|uniref:type IV pilus assembly protein PilM n=1 Tax=Vibrio fluvialis TaxID=676 RepID=UPI001EE9D55C|nr:type IV pilus assembly protein PilM [Vibrio fluvialis]MCG6342616.1 type IV pilus assembly protein PilM [Vibrio fluvialis]